MNTNESRNARRWAKSLRRTRLLQKIPLLHSRRVAPPLLASLLATGFAASSRRVHGLLAGLLSALALVVTGLAVAGILRLDLRVG